MICNKCKEDLPETEFAKRKENTSGREYSCRLCRNAGRALAANKRLVIKQQMEYIVGVPV